MKSNIELFDNYVNEKFTIEEREDFESKLSQNSDFKSEFEQYQLLLKGIQFSGQNDIKKRLQKHESQLKSSSSRSSFMYKIAASIVLITTVTILLLNKSYPNYESIYSEYYQPYPNIIDPIDRSTNQASNALSIYQKYDLNRFTEVIATIESKQEISSDTVKFYLAQSYLAVGNFRDALNTLNEVSEPSSIFVEPSQWYTALVLVKLERKEEAQKILEKIIGDNGSYSAKATKLRSDF